MSNTAALELQEGLQDISALEPLGKISCKPSILSKAIVVLIYFLLDSTNVAMSL